MLNDPTPVAFTQSIDELGVFLYSQKLASSKTRFLLGFSFDYVLLTLLYMMSIAIEPILYF